MKLDIFGNTKLIWKLYLSIACWCLQILERWNKDWSYTQSISKKSMTTNVPKTEVAKNVLLKDQSMFVLLTVLKVCENRTKIAYSPSFSQSILPAKWNRLSLCANSHGRNGREERLCRIIKSSNYLTRQWHLAFFLQGLELLMADLISLLRK